MGSDKIGSKSLLFASWEEWRGGSDGCDATARWLVRPFSLSPCSPRHFSSCRRRPRAPRSATSERHRLRVGRRGECGHGALQGPHRLESLGSARLGGRRPRPCARGSRSARRPGSRSTCSLSNIVADHRLGASGLPPPATGRRHRIRRELYRTGTGTSNNLAHRPRPQGATAAPRLHRRVPDRAGRHLRRRERSPGTPRATKAVTLAGMVVADAETTNNSTERSGCARSPFNGCGREMADHRRLRRHVRHQTYGVYREAYSPGPAPATGIRLNMSAPASARAGLRPRQRWRSRRARAPLNRHAGCVEVGA